MQARPLNARFISDSVDDSSLIIKRTQVTPAFFLLYILFKIAVIVLLKNEIRVLTLKLEE